MPRDSAIFGIPSQNFFLIILSFSEGLIVSSKLAFFFICRNVYNLDMTAFGHVETMVSVLMCFKPGYGYISDCFPIAGRRRKFYLFFFSLLALACHTIIALNRELNIKIYVLVSCYLLIEVSNNFRAVVVDAVCVEIKQKLKKQQKAEGIASNSLYLMLWGRHLGTLFSIVLMMCRFVRFMSRFFFFYAVASLCTFVISSVMEDPPIAKPPSRPGLFSEIRKSFGIIVKKGMSLTLVAYFITLSAPYIQSVLNYYLTGVLNFNYHKTSCKMLISKLFVLVAVLSRGLVFKKFSRSRLLNLSSMANLLSMIYCIYVVKFFGAASLAAEWNVYAFIALESYTSEMRTMPMIEAFMEHAPKESPGFFISTLSFATSLAKTLSVALTTFITKQLGISKIDFGKLPEFLGIHIGVGVVGYLILLVSQVRMSHKKAETQVSEDKNLHETEVPPAKPDVVPA